MTLETTRWNVLDYLGDDESIAAYLEAAFEIGDPAFILTAINDVARARGIADIAGETGLTRQALYKALGPQGNPRLSTLMAVLKTLGVRLSVAPGQHVEAA